MLCVCVCVCVTIATSAAKCNAGAAWGHSMSCISITCCHNAAAVNYLACSRARKHCISLDRSLHSWERDTLSNFNCRDPFRCKGLAYDISSSSLPPHKTSAAYNLKGNIEERLPIGTSRTLSMLGERWPRKRSIFGLYAGLGGGEKARGGERRSLELQPVPEGEPNIIEGCKACE